MLTAKVCLIYFSKHITMFSGWKCPTTFFSNGKSNIQFQNNFCQQCHRVQLCCSTLPMFNNVAFPMFSIADFLLQMTKLSQLISCTDTDHCEALWIGSDKCYTHSDTGNQIKVIINQTPLNCACYLGDCSVLHIHV